VSIQNENISQTITKYLNPHKHDAVELRHLPAQTI